MSLEELELIFDSTQIIKDKKNLNFYGRDWIRHFESNPSIVVFPKSTEQVVKLVQWARKSKQALVPSGGRTGLSGGATANQKEVVVSFEKMNQLVGFDEFEQSITIQPGMITKEVQKKSEEQGFLMPISFAAEGSSQIGGNVATNAGGVNVIRYGAIRNWIRGLQVVTGEGLVLNLGKNLVKDATGYNLMHLFIGSEGTLGFITEVSLSLARRPSSLCVLLLGVNKLSQLMEVYAEFKKKLPLQAFEMFTEKALYFVEQGGKQKNPLSKKFPYYVLIEIEEKYQNEALKIFEDLLNRDQIEDGVLSQNSEQAQSLWALRENISESLSAYNPYKNDIAVRISNLTSFLLEMDELLIKEYPQYEVVWFGHIGDGNLHINIFKSDGKSDEKFIQDCERVNQLLFSKLRDFEGTISAEHGVGLLKKNHLHYSKSQEEIEYMRKIKKIFDPDGIINPNKIFD